MTDRLAELGALAYAAENTATASTSPNRLGGAGYLHAAYAEYQTWAAANPSTNPSRLSAKGRLFGYFYDNASWSPSSLFTAGEQGAWYDPSDFSTMFKDAAGTTPVTAVEQPVGLILDKSKNGVGTNGAARYNLQSYTQQFDNAAWNRLGLASVTANDTTAPDGTTTADRITEDTGLGRHILYRVSVLSSNTYKASIYAKAGTRDRIILKQDDVPNISAIFNLDIGVVGNTANCTANITAVGNGWYLCVMNFTSVGANNFHVGLALNDTYDANNESSYLGTGAYAYVWGLDVRLASNAALLPAYQVITSDWFSTIPGNHASQSTTTNRPILRQDAGGKYYLAFDGADDSLSTASIDFTGTDKMSVWFGSYLTAAGYAGYPAFFAAGTGGWTDTPNQFGCFNNATSGPTPFFAGNTAVNNIEIGNSGSATKFTVHSQGDLTAATASEMTPQHRLNDVTLGTPEIRTPAGSLTGVIPAGGNFGTNVLSIGKRVIGASMPLSGNIYSLIIRGALSSAQEITDTETWVNSKTGAY